MKTVVSGIIRKGDKVLLIKRGSESFYGFWAGVGGHIDEGENPKKAIVREIKEELGVDFKIRRELGSFEFKGKTPEGDETHTIHLGFEGQISGEINLNKGEVLDCDWFTYEETKKLKLTPNYRHFLKISFETITS